MSELTNRIRAQQATGGPVSREEMARLFAEQIGSHDDHAWHKVGRCVYCGPCGVRLYQGNLPKDHPRWAPPSRANRTTATMRDQWGMDDRSEGKP